MTTLRAMFLPLGNSFYISFAFPQVVSRENDLSDFVKEVSKPFHEDLSLQARMVDFLLNREDAGELLQAKFFLRNLSRLRSIKYEDGSSIWKVGRLFRNAESAVKKEQRPSGFYFEAIAALSLIDAGFKVTRISKRRTTENGNITRLQGNDGVSREVDIVAEKVIDGKKVQFYIEVKPSIGKVIENINEITALMEIAKESKAKQVVLFKDRDPVLTEDGELIRYEYIPFSKKEVKQIKNCSAEHPELLIWTLPREDCRNIGNLVLIPESISQNLHC